MSSSGFNDLNGEYGGDFIAEGCGGAVFKSAEGHAVKYVLDNDHHDSRGTMAREAHYLECLQGQAFRVPQFISYEAVEGQVNVKGSPRAYIGIIQSELIEDGHFLTVFDVQSRTPQEQLEAFHSATQLLTKIHAAKPPAMPGEPSILRQRFEETYEKDKQRHLRQGFYNALSQKLDELEGHAEPVFCHGDYSFDNMICEEGKGFTGVIDVGQSGYGMPETDLRHYFMNPQMQQSIVDVYEAQTGRVIDPERLKMVDLVNSFSRMINVAYGEPYEDQQTDYNAMQGRVQRLAENSFYIPFQTMSWGNVPKPTY